MAHDPQHTAAAAVAVLRHLLTPPRRGEVYSEATGELRWLDASGWVEQLPQHSYSDPGVYRWVVTPSGREAWGVMRAGWGRAPAEGGG